MWLRWFRIEGELIPIPIEEAQAAEERASIAQERAIEAQERALVDRERAIEAEEKAERLAGQLRELGIDVHDKVAKNPDYTIAMTDIKAWEKKHGQIPEGAFVAMRTDWSKRWPDSNAMANKDKPGIAHYPGWSLPVLQYLYEERHITASGHEPTDTDPGIATSKDNYSLKNYILQQNHYQIELLTNLDKVPESGALVMVSFPKPMGGSGFPARVIAILP